MVLLRNIGSVTFLVVVLTGLLAALFVDCGSLLDAGIVRLELESGVGREVEDLLHDFAEVTNGKLVGWFTSNVFDARWSLNVPDLEHATAVGSGPDAQDILAIAHAQDSTTHVLPGVAELIANQRQQEVLPVSIRHALLEADNPLASLAIDLVLPYWPNILLEQMIVGHDGQA